MFSSVYRLLAVLPVLLFAACGPKQGTLTGDVFIVTQGGENVKLGLVEVQVLPADAAKKAVDETTRQAEQVINQLRPNLEAAKSDLQAKTAANGTAEAEYNSAHANYINHILSESAARRYEAAEKLWLQSGKSKADAEQAVEGVEGMIRHAKSGEVYFKHLPPAIASTKTDADGKFSITIDSTTPVVLAAHATRKVVDKAENYYWLVRVSLDGQPTKRIFLSNDNLATVRNPESIVLLSE